MPTCEICGRRTSKLYKIRLEGAEMLVCENCKKYGELISEVSEPKPVKKVVKKPKVEKEEVVVENYAEIIRGIREKLGLTQADFAKKLGERESLMRKIEDGKLIPTIQLAKKIEREFGVHLVEEIDATEYSVKSPEKEEVTLGDVVDLKVRKK